MRVSGLLVAIYSKGFPRVGELLDGFLYLVSLI